MKGIMEDPKKSEQNYLGWFWDTAKDYARHSYPLSYVYGRLRGYAQPWLSTSFNVHEISRGVYIGDIASASNFKELKALGITHIVIAVLGVTPQFPNAFRYRTLPVMDVETEDIRPYFNSTIEFIDNAVVTGGKVLVHCMCGVSRSATIVAAWLMTQNGCSVDETIKFLQEKRQCVNPNPAFRDQLEIYKTENRPQSTI